MDQGRAVLVRDAGETPNVQRHRERVLGTGRKRDPNPTFGLKLANKPATFGRNQRPRAYRHEACRDIDCGALGPARLEIGNNLQDRAPCQRMGARGQGRRAGSRRTIHGYRKPLGDRVR